MLIDKCLIIDNKLEEVKDIIFKLNEEAISTDYREDILGKDKKINRYTQLVILDLYMSEDQSNYNDAIDSVNYLSDEIEGPYFILIWTKHQEEFNNFYNKINNSLESLNNPPLEIRIMDINKTSGELSGDIVNKAVNFVTDYIDSIEKRNKNISSYIKISNLFREKSFLLWELFDYKKTKKQLKTIQEINEYYNDIVAKAFNRFDESQNFEKSGKGFLNIQARFLENYLTLKPLDYSEVKEHLDKDIKDKINHRLCIHELHEGRKMVQPIPGIIMKNPKMKISDFTNYFENDNLKDCPIELGEIIITPYCDYANKKRKNILYLPILIIDSGNDYQKTKKSFRANITLLDLCNKRFIAYKVSELSEKSIDKEFIEDFYDFYLNKEFVNEIQINVANNLSRIGTTTI